MKAYWSLRTKPIRLGWGSASSFTPWAAATWASGAARVDSSRQ
jgi:hypothetical protein